MTNKKISYLAVSLWASFILGLTGCVSGSFKLTRQYASFVNKQEVIIRVVLYILTSVVFAVTMLVDVVLNNTMDFWNGRMAAGTYNFNHGTKTYVVEHRFNNKLRESTIRISEQGKPLETMVLREIENFKIDVIVDGLLKGTISDITQIPVLSLYNKKGETIKTHALWNDSQIAKAE